jgi:hypothetical protein
MTPDEFLDKIVPEPIPADPGSSSPPPQDETPAEK